jgi:transaldolase
MKFYLDCASLASIKKYNKMGLVDGVTTNPSLVSKEAGAFEDIITSICKEVNGPVSAEVVGIEHDAMVKEGVHLSKLAPNVVVKVPMTPEGLQATKTLNGMGIPVNVTLIFSANQGLLAAKAGASYLSPFIGRLDDIGERGMQVIEDLVTIKQNYKLRAEILVASIRGPQHVLEAAKLGAGIATMPPDVMEKMMHHPLTDIGLKKFLDDWNSAKKESATISA